MHTPLQKMERDKVMSLSSLQVLKLDPSAQPMVAEALVPPRLAMVSKMKVLLFTLASQVNKASPSGFRICCIPC